MTLHLISHFNGSHLLKPFHEIYSCYNPQSLRLSSKPQVFVYFPSVSRQAQIERLVVCARRRRRGSAFGRTGRVLLKSLSLLVLNLKILPQPLDLVLSELGGGDGAGGGGGLGFRRGIGGWGGFDGWRRKAKRFRFFWLFLCVVLGFYGLCLISGKEIKRDSILPVLGLCIFGIDLFKASKIKSRNLIFAFLCFGALLIVSFKQEHIVKLIGEIRACSSALLCPRRNKRSRRRV